MSFTARAKTKVKITEPELKITWKEIKRQKVLLFWAAIIVIYGFIFYYMPLGGWAMAFENYKPKDGIFHSEFVGFDKLLRLVLKLLRPVLIASRVVSSNTLLMISKALCLESIAPILAIWLRY